MKSQRKGRVEDDEVIQDSYKKKMSSTEVKTYRKKERSYAKVVS